MLVTTEGRAALLHALHRRLRLKPATSRHGATALRVLMTFGVDATSDTGNPYPRLLLGSLPPDVHALTFSWRTALLGCYEVLHVHWPEHLLQGSASRRVMQPLLLALLILRCRVRSIVVVRTVHNREPHQQLSPVGAWLVNRLDKQTRVWIHLTASTVPPRGDEARHRTIPHGHYRDVYNYVPPVGECDSSRSLLYFGPIWPYKGVPQLLEAFTGTDMDYRLRVIGVPEYDLRAEIDRFETDARVEVRLEYLSNSALRDQIADASAIVLPYTRMTNSGALLLALSLNRPVLVPAVDVAVELQDEYGREWVLMYEPPLTASKLHGLIQELLQRDNHKPLNMVGREWTAIGSATRDAYLFARQSTRRCM